MEPRDASLSFAPLVDNPLATIEERACHCIVLQLMAEILAALGEDTRADDFAARSSALSARLGVPTTTCSRRRGAFHIITFPPPQDTDTRDEHWRDRLKEWFLEHAPGRTAAALRFALGVLEA